MEKGAHAVRIEHVAAIRIVLGGWVNLLRSSIVGLFTGILPAAGGSIANILAYDQAKKNSRHPERFVRGLPQPLKPAAEVWINPPENRPQVRTLELPRDSKFVSQVSQSH